MVNSRQGGCPDCAQYIGRVFIDDVYSGGSVKNGKYPLLSEAISGGLFHPRCKDSTSTYYEGITTLKPATEDEIDDMKRQEALEQQKSYYENQAKKCGRISEYSLDSDNKRAYAKRAEVWQDKAEETAENLDETVAKSAESGIMNNEKEKSPRKNKNGDFSVDWSKIQSNEYSDKIKKLSDNKKVCSAIETRAKWSLNNRDGLNTEEIYAVDLVNGNEVAKITDQQYERGVKRTTLFTRKVDEADKILLLHNHPSGFPPSINDINALYNNTNVSGITVGHNGSIYYYTRPNAIISDDDWNIAMRHFNKFSDVTAMEKTLVLLSKKYQFTFIKL